MEARNVLIAFAALAACAPLTGCVEAQAKAGAKAEHSTVELVVFTDDFAMVNDIRELTLDEGRNDVTLTGVSDQIDQNSAAFFWPDGGAQSVVSTTFERGVQNGQQMLERYVGKQVTLVYRGTNGKVGERQEGVLEVASPGNVVVRVGDTYVVNPDATIEVPATSDFAVMQGFRAVVDSPKSGRSRMGLSYLTRGLSWRADYVAVLQKDEDLLNLELWATVQNRTKAEFRDAKIRFVAGSPNRAAVTSKAMQARGGVMTMGVPYDDGVAYDREAVSVALGELHAYPYEARATIGPNQDSRVKLLESASVTAKRDYAIRLSPVGPYGNYGRPDQRIQATLSIKIKNSEENGLGEPLPAGTVRFYEPGDDGALSYIGASPLPDMPKDASQSLTLTEVFDVYALQKVADAKRINKRTVERSVEITVYNEKDTDVELRLVQDFWQNWKIVEESAESTKLAARLVQWKVTIPAGGEATIKYRVRLS
ncbi:MAG: hypothetical protein IH945_13285 [Armatimonadetes bacterium]|nr:hypothetical protein [Armatimonadota bacterium]